MAREELARLLSCLLKRGQSARCCDDLAEFESRLFAELLHWKNSFRWVRFLLLRGTAEGGALKANALPGGAKRLAVRAVKGAQFAFIGAKRETLDRRSGRSRRRFSAGRANAEWSLRCVVKSGGISLEPYVKRKRANKSHGRRWIHVCRQGRCGIPRAAAQADVPA